MRMVECGLDKAYKYRVYIWKSERGKMYGTDNDCDGDGDDDEYNDYDGDGYDDDGGYDNDDVLATTCIVCFSHSHTLSLCLSITYTHHPQLRIGWMHVDVRAYGAHTSKVHSMLLNNRQQCRPPRIFSPKSSERKRQRKNEERH